MARPVYVIVGAGLAGAKAAETLRGEGFDGELVVVGAERERPYERPPLSKSYLAGRSEREALFVHPQGWYAEHDVDLRLGNGASELRRDEHEIVLDDGSRLSYDKLLLTTGSSPRRLRVPGADAEGVCYLRTLASSERLRSAVAAASRVVVVGGGWIGLETAADARGKDRQVAVVEVAELPLLGVLGAEVAEVFAGLHRENGVDLRCSAAVAEVAVAGGRARAVVLADGSELPADLVVVGVGVAPNTRLAEQAGLAVDNGVVVDERLCSSDPDVYAAGDVANAYHPLFGRQLRVEHWANALNQSQAAARNMLGGGQAYDRLPYFFSDQYDLGMEYSGWVEPGGYDQVVFRGDRAGRVFVACWLAGGRVQAGMNVNVWDVTEPLAALVRSGRAVDPARLADPAVPLADLLAD